MSTLKVIFVGLMALTTVNDEKEAIVHLVEPHPSQARHFPLILQKEGNCTGTCVWPVSLGKPFDCDIGGNKLCWMPMDVDLEIEGLDESDLVLAGGRPTVDGRPIAVPQRPQDSHDLSWLPSVQAVIPGFAPLRPACRTSDSDCRVWSRLRVDDGRLSSCHFLHIPRRCGADSGKLLLYRINGRAQAVANALLWETGFSLSSIKITARNRVSGAVEATAVLTPNAQDLLLLVFENEPAILGAPGRRRCAPLPSLAHFRSYYGLVDPVLGVFGRQTRRVPVLDGYATGVLGSCENVISDYERIARDKYGKRAPSFPHGGSECDMATIP